MYGTCVVDKTYAFTLFDDYEINDLTVKADNGDIWYLHDVGDGYVGCRSREGRRFYFWLMAYKHDPARSGLFYSISINAIFSAIVFQSRSTA